MKLFLIDQDSWTIIHRKPYDLNERRSVFKFMSFLREANILRGNPTIAFKENDEEMEKYLEKLRK